DAAPLLTYALSLHDALPIYAREDIARASGGQHRGVRGVDRGALPLRSDQGVAPLQQRDVAIRSETGHRAEAIGLHVGSAALEHRSEEHTSELQSRENLVCRL